MDFVKKALPYAAVAIGSIGFGLWLATTSVGASIIGAVSGAVLPAKAN